MSKVIYLLGSLNRGGAETLILDVFNNASKANFEFEGIYRKGGVLEQAFKSTNVTFKKLSPKFPFDPNYLRCLRSLVLSQGAEIVHAQQYIDAVYAKIALLGTNVKIVQTYHGYDLGQSRIGDFLIKTISKRIDCNIFVSENQREFFVKKLRLPLERTAVIYNGLNFAKLGDVKKRIPRDGKVIMGTVGNFVKGRDPMTLCRFLKKLDEEKISFEFYFVGRRGDKTPYYFDDCERFCKISGLESEVHFLGGRNDVPELLTNWDVFLYSTDHDTFGIAVVEAIASGLPVFVNDWEVMREVSLDGKYAVLYETKNTDDLYNKFQLFLNDKQKYYEMAANNAVEIRRTYSIESHLQSLYKLYNKILLK